MIRKKNNFMTFLCSMIPGAGEMYLGFMKEGLSIMGTAYVLLFAGFYLNIEPLVLLTPILWFYSVFNVHNKATLPDEEFYALEDEYLFHIKNLFLDGKLAETHIPVLGWLFILTGVSVIWNETVQSFLAVIRIYISDNFSRAVGNFLYDVPRYMIAAALILCGIRLIWHKKEALYKEQDKEEGKNGLNGKLDEND